MGHAGRVVLQPRFRFCVLALLALLGALLLRVTLAQGRPFHTDEAVNAFIVEETLGEGFHYRAHDHHGPTLFLLTAAMLGPTPTRNVAEMDAGTLRLIPETCGVLVVASLYFFFPYIGKAATLAAMVMLAVLAPFVYYSGSFIHESLLILLLSLYLAAFWRFLERGRMSSAVAAGVLAGLMLATKETAALILAAVSLAGLLTRGADARKGLAARGGSDDPAGDADELPRVKTGRLVRGGALAVGVAFATVLLVFSSFGRHPERAFDLFSAIGAQVGRGLGAEHAYPWFTYARWFSWPGAAGLPWSGWVLPALGLAGLAAGWRQPFVRFLALSGALVFCVFSALPYKTPWLMLAWELPLALVAAVGVAHGWKQGRLVQIGLCGVFLLLGFETFQRCHRFAVDPRNSLAYSPSSPDLARLEHDLDALMMSRPEGRETLVQVIATDYWPLPWTLRKFPHVGYWTDTAEVQPEAVVLCSAEYIGRLPGREGKFEAYELRPGVHIFLARK